MSTSKINHWLCGGFLPRAKRSQRVSIVIGILAGAALLVAAQAVEAKGKPAGTGGPNPGTSQVLPVSLGPAPECMRTGGFALNSGDTAGLYVVGQGQGCDNPGNAGAIRWSGGLGMHYLGLLPGATGSSAEGISEDGTVVGWTGGDVGQAFVLEPGAVDLLKLQPLAGMDHATANSISGSGEYIAGSSSTETDYHAVVWRRNTGTWQPQDLGPTTWDAPTAISDDGRTLVNTTDGPWSEKSSIFSAWVVGLNGDATALPGSDVYARDISVGGDVVVGYRRAACANPCGKYPVPVYWKRLANGRWSGPVDLPALDGVDSEAMSVAVRSGRLLIVGHGFTKKDAIMRAVAWIEDSQGRFSLTRLAAIDGKGKSWARAMDVNVHGQVTGTSQATGLAYYAVLWQLPQ